MKSKRVSAGIMIVVLALTGLLAVLLVLAGTKQPSDEPASVVRAVAPNYPPLALAARVSGSVILDVVVDSQGSAGSLRIIEGPNLLRAAVETAAKRWTFRDAGGGTGPRTVRLTFIFKILPEGTPSEELLSSFMPPYTVEVREKPGRIVQNPNVDPSPRTRKKAR